MDLVSGKVITKKPYQKALAWGGFWLVISCAALTVTYRNFSAEGMGRLLALTLISSAIVGFMASRAKTPWSLLKVGLIYFAVAVLLLLISSYGALQRG